MVVHTSPTAETKGAPNLSASTSRPLWEKKIRYFPQGSMRLTAPGASAVPASTRMPSLLTRYRLDSGALPLVARSAMVFKKPG